MAGLLTVDLSAAGTMDEWPGFGSSTPFAGPLWEPAPRPGSSLWTAAELSGPGSGGTAWPADPARPSSALAGPFSPGPSSPWAPGAAADSGWPQGFPADDADK